MKKAESLLIKGENPNSFNNNKHALSALHLAVINKNRELIELLLKYGADIDIFQQAFAKRVTPLMLAIRADDIPTVKILLRNGANINIGSTNTINCSTSTHELISPPIFYSK